MEQSPEPEEAAEGLKMKAFRLSTTDQARLTRLCARLEIKEAQVVRQAIRLLAEREGVA